MIHRRERQQQKQHYESHSNESKELSSSSSSSRTNKHYDLQKLIKIFMTLCVLTLIADFNIMTLIADSNIMTMYENSSKDNDTMSLQMHKNNISKNHRKFISYTSSKWEKLWLSNIKYWEKNELICYAITKQKAFLQEFLNATCTTRIMLKDGNLSDWCLHDDAFEPFWINVNTLKVNDQGRMPDVITIINLKSQTITNLKSQPYELHNLPEDEDGSPFIFSKFIFLNEHTNETYVEYIEPLVSHLRHPLAKCNACYTFDDSIDINYDSTINNSTNITGAVDERSKCVDDFFVIKRSYVIPPSSYRYRKQDHNQNNANINKRKYYYFDAGASSWKLGAGGPSLDYFTKMWSRHNINFDLIEAWEGNTQYDDFNKTVPEIFSNKTMFHHAYIVSTLGEHNNKNPFLPLVIKEKTKIDDYVLFKLDIDNGPVEIGTVNHLLQLNNNTNNHLDYIDEFVWEHHVEGNYLLKKNWKEVVAKGVTLYDSYQLFLKLRQRGVRAHSWV